MPKTLGSWGGRLCRVCAMCFCAVILLQNLLALPSTQPLAVLLGLVAGAGVLLLCLRYLRPIKGFALFLFALRFALALCFILWLDSQPVQDFNSLYTAANQLAQGSHAYLDNLYFFNWAYQSAFMAYEALVISLFGSSLLPLQLLNGIYLAMTDVLVYLIARKLTGERVAMMAGLLYALYPAPLFLAGVLTNQHLSVFLFYAGVYLLVKQRELSPLRALGAGALLALGNAMRPIGVIPLLAAVIWCVLCALRRTRWRTLLHGALVATSYFAVGAALTGLIVVSGINPEGLVNNQPMWKFAVGLNEDSNGCWNAADYEAFLSLPTQEGHEAMTEAVKERLSVGIPKLAGLAWRKSAVMWAANEDLYWGFGHLDPEEAALSFPVTLSWNRMQLLLGGLDKGVYLLAFTLALVGLLSRLRRSEGCGRTLLLTLLVCGYYAVHLIVEVQVRYRYFLMPCIFVLAALALERLFSKQTT